MALPRFSRKFNSLLYASLCYIFNFTLALFYSITSIRRFSVSFDYYYGFLGKSDHTPLFCSNCESDIKLLLLCYYVLRFGTQMGSLFLSPQMMSNFSLKIKGLSRSKRSISLIRFRFPLFLFFEIFSAADNI